MFTIVFIFSAMTYFVVKMVTLSGDKSKNYPVDNADN